MKTFILSFVIAISSSICYGGQWVPAIHVQPTVPMIVVPPVQPQVRIVRKYVLSPVVKMVPIPVHKIGLFGRTISEHLEYQWVTTWEYVAVDMVVIE